MSPKSASIIGDKVPAAQKEGREIETSGKVSRGNSETYLHQMPLKNFIGRDYGHNHSGILCDQHIKPGPEY